jgi:uncharacterized protein with gpF-like domain
MAYNVSQRDRDRASARDVKLKMQHEEMLKRALFFGYFAPLARDLQTAYSNFATTPNFDNHNQNLNIILDNHYQNVQKDFDSQIRDNLGELENGEFIEEQIRAELEIERQRDVMSSSQSIADTTHKKMKKTIEEIIAAFVAAGLLLKKERIAKEAKDKFITDSQNRLDGIAITQTQFASEGAKFGEGKTLDRLNAVFPAAKVDFSKAQSMKTWVAVLDARTRPAHAEADGQTVPLKEPYIVMGQKLMRPGDTTLGATMDNIANCRCTSVISVKA